MKTLYLECNMGAAGDMLNAALLELHPEPEKFVERMNSLGLPGVTYAAETAVKCGICGTHVSVKVGEAEEESVDVPTGHVHTHEHAHEHGHEHAHCHEEHPQHDHACEQDHHHHELHCHEEHDHHHEDHVHSRNHAGEEVHTHHEFHCHNHAETHENHQEEHCHHHEHAHTHAHHHDHHGHAHYHAGMHDIHHIVDHLDIPEKVKADVLAVYQLIAEAESHAHGRGIDEIHFHEVGTLDAITDVVGACLLLHELAPERIVASPVHVGSGQVRCAHGILPVPAPATAYILRGVPIYGGQIRAELCTPTGAALLKHFADSFGLLPCMAVERIGYGMGKKEFEAANCVRAMLGEA